MSVARFPPWSIYLAVFTLAILSVAPAAGAVPDEVTVTAFARPVGSHLQLLVRVPMVAFGDIQFPERGAENYLDLVQVDAMVPGVAKYRLAPSLEVYENDVLLPRPVVVGTRVALESDQSFSSYNRALAHFSDPPIDAGTNVFWRQAWLDILFEYPIRSERSDFSIRFSLAHLGARVTTDLTFLAPDGAIRSLSYSGDPGLIRPDPGRYEAALQFLQRGLFHFLKSSDYLLFVFCLVFPLRRLEESFPVAAAFVCASSVTFFASAFGLAPSGLWFQPLIETAIPASILFLALANIAGWLASDRRVVSSLAFGLLLGFGFSFGLGSEIQFAGAHPVVSALAFDVGVQLGFAAALAVLIPSIQLLVRFTRFQPMERVVPSVLAAHTAWHWMTERWDRLVLFRFQWPVIDAVFLAAALRWLMILLLLAGGARFIAGIVRSKSHAEGRSHEA